MTTVLVIDDNAMNRKLARDVFNADGFRTVPGRVLAARRENSLIAADGSGEAEPIDELTYRSWDGGSYSCECWDRGR